MTREGLRQQDARCRAALDALEAFIDWQAVATIQQLCRAIGRARQRDIHLEAQALPAPLAGLSCAGRERDYIFYADDAPQPLQEHTILHEVAHILLGVPRALRCAFIDACDLQAPLPASVIAALDRTGYNDKYERMAELLASLIAQRWYAQRHRTGALPAWLHTRADLTWLAAQTAGEW